jgi:hypothetical protein
LRQPNFKVAIPVNMNINKITLLIAPLLLISHSNTAIAKKCTAQPEKFEIALTKIIKIQFFMTDVVPKHGVE